MEHRKVIARGEVKK